MPKGFGRPLKGTLRGVIKNVDKAESEYRSIGKEPPEVFGDTRAKIGKWMDEDLSWRQKQAAREKDLLSRTAERRKTSPQAFKKGGMVKGQCRDYSK